MEVTKKWFLLKTEEDYDEAMARYQKLKSAVKGTEEHKEKMLLTVSKVLDYKQSLSLSMIRKFSSLLKIPAEWLIKEYPLQKTG